MAELRDPVGRAAELAALDQVVQQATPGGFARIVAVVGEPGIGKTRLLAALADRAAAAGRLVLSGQASEYERHLPYAALVDALDDHCDTVELDLPARDRADLATVLPGLPPDRPDTAQLEPDQTRLRRALRTLLAGLAAPHGLVLIIDDVHWADEATIAFLAYLARHPPRCGLVVALASRTGRLPYRLEADLDIAAAAGRGARIELGPLPATVVRAWLPPSIDDRRCAQLHRAGNGNPFYIEALARTGPEVAVAAGDPDIIDDLPGRVATALKAELSGLTHQQRTVAYGAAIAGDRFDVGLVATAAGLDRDRTAGALDVLAERDLIRSIDGHHLRYRHPLVRHVVAADAGPGWRFAAHARIAAELARLDAPIIERAHHVALAGDRCDPTGAELLATAAEQLRFQAPSVAASWLGIAVDRLPATADTQRVAYGIRRADALGRSGDLHAAAELLARLLPDAPAERRGQVVRECAMFERLIGNHQRARALLAAERARHPDPDTIAAAELALEDGIGRYVSGEQDIDREPLHRAFATAKRLGDRGMQAYAAAIIALAAALDGAIPEALTWLDVAAKSYDALSDTELASRLAAVLMWCENHLERPHDALRHSRRAAAVARATGQTYMLTYLLVSQASSLSFLGRLAEAQQVADDAVEAALACSSDELLATAQYLRCVVAAQSGDLDHALQSGAAAAALDNGGWAGSRSQGTLAMVRIETGEPVEDVHAELLTRCGTAGERVEPAARPAFFDALTSVALRRGDLEQAIAAARLAGEHAHPQLPASTGFALRAQARVHLGQEDPEAAAVSATAAAAAFLQVDAGYDAGISHLHAGQALRAAGDTAAAHAALTRAGLLLERCGARRSLAHVRREQRKLGRQPDPDGDPIAAAHDRLTAREREVARLIVTGCSNADIAEQLVISHHTVARHVAHILAKLQLRSRSGVAAAMLGLLEPDNSTVRRSAGSHAECHSPRR